MQTDAWKQDLAGILAEWHEREDAAAARVAANAEWWLCEIEDWLREHEKFRDRDHLCAVVMNLRTCIDALCE